MELNFCLETNHLTITSPHHCLLTTRAAWFTAYKTKHVDLTC